MENPATWGLAERTVSKVLSEFFQNQEKPITDESKTICGRSLERRITDSLREAGLLKEESPSGSLATGRARSRPQPPPPDLEDHSQYDCWSWHPGGAGAARNSHARDVPVLELLCAHGERE